ncbi:hypothetical protein ABZ601_33655 [Streptomyces sp. NPDC012842]|uniref:hypothetical protein n=1 Tax=Streptomyces TaxID=1883 RepID=UPI00340C5362
MKEYPSDLRAAAGPVRSTLCHVRETEITDSLVELFIQLVQKINTRAEKKVEGEFNKELKRVRGKEGILLRLTEAAVAEPGGRVRKVIYPVAGESTLKAMAAEAAANEARYRARVRMVLRSSYSNHWRRMLSSLLNALELKCNNTAYRPVMDAIDLLKRYLNQPIAKECAFFDEAEKIPLGGGVPLCPGSSHLGARRGLREERPSPVPARCIHRSSCRSRQDMVMSVLSCDSWRRTR